MKRSELLIRITCDPDIFGGKPILRGHRLAVQHVLDMLAAGDDPATILSGYPWMEPADIKACLVFASLPASASAVTSATREDFERYLAAVPHGELVETDRLPDGEPSFDREITRKEHEI